jgi:hypothetical protein
LRCPLAVNLVQDGVLGNRLFDDEIMGLDPKFPRGLEDGGCECVGFVADLDQPLPLSPSMVKWLPPLLEAIS